MDKYQKKLLEAQGEDEVEYFKYMFYGKTTLITSKQFIQHLPKLDIGINILFLLVNIFYLNIYNGSKFDGFTKFLKFGLFLNLVPFLIFIFFKLKIEEEIKKEKSLIYKIYFFTRLFFITFSITSIFVYYFVFDFLVHLEDCHLDDDIKLSLIESLEIITPPVKTVSNFNLFFSGIAILFFTHQMYWTSFLDESWCGNNMFTKNRRAKAIVDKEKEIENDKD